MKSQPSIAKAKRYPWMVDGADRAWLSLLNHCADVAAVAEALLALPTVARRLARLAEREALTASDIQRLCVLVALHDLGKVNGGFQAHIRGQKTPNEKPNPGHIAPLVALLWSDASGGDKVQKPIRDLLRTSIGWQELEGWCGGGPGLNDLLLAVLAHHGDVPNKDDHVFNQPKLWQESAEGDDPMAEAARLGAAVRVWFPAALESGGRPLPTAPRFLHAFAGLVVLADWLGSDETRFPYPREEAASEADRIALARERAANVIADRHLEPSRRRAAVPARPFDFGALFEGKTPRPAQAAVLAAAVPEDGQVMILEAETGSGKTEAALLHFLRLLAEGKVDGLYFALPTRASAKQIQGRLQRALTRILGDTAPVGLAVPGYLKIDDQEGQPLPEFRVHWPDDGKQNLRDRGWAVEQPRRYLAGAVMVGTIDQLLLGGLQVKHAHIRSSAMLRQLLVIDEVHASDTYMERLLRTILDQHRAAGGYALLMSATLGSGSRARLLGELGSRATAPPLADALAAPYPALHASAGAMPEVVKPAEAADKAVAITVHDDHGDLAPLVTRALEAVRQGARVLVIRNKVDDAVAFQIALERTVGPDSALLFGCDGRAAPHHARFAAEDRVLLDAALEARFGGSATGGVVAVTTQTAEQSLDIDADLMISDLAPVDVLLQRIGRLHRHTRCRPAGFETPRLVVIAPPHERIGAALDERGEAKADGRSLLGLGKVYPDLTMLAATRQLLTDYPTWRLPAMNRQLVEAATHDEALEAVAKALGPKWWRHRQKVAGIAMADDAVGGLNSIAWEAPPEPYPGGGGNALIRTRLGLDNRIARLPEALPGPLGRPVCSFVLPGWMVAKDTPPDAEVTAATTQDGVITFKYGKQAFVYDRHGLRKNGR